MCPDTTQQLNNSTTQQFNNSTKITMKKVSLMLGALALVLGLSQCNKEKSPVQAGEKQYIEVAASNGNDGSKVNVDFASVPTVMNLTWEKGDVITVSGGAEGTLTLDEGVGTAQGHFSGEITMGAGGELTFTYKKCESTPDFGAQDGTSAWIKNNLYLEAKANYNEAGKYSLLMEMPYAVLKLDLSTLVGTQNNVTIKAGANPVVIFESLAKADAEEMFVAVPADGTEQTYTFIGNDKIVGKTWTLAASTYYTAECGNAAVIKPFKYSVAEGVSVEFAPGNLYWDGSDSKWKFEANQWDYRTHEGESAVIGGLSTTTPANNWGLFGWSGSIATAAWGKSTSTRNVDYSGDFKDWGGNTIDTDAENTWRTLTADEWNYLINMRKVKDATGFGNTCVWATVNGVGGLIIFADNYTGATSGLTSIPEGAVFLPAAGFRYGTDVRSVGQGFYSSSTPNVYNAYYMFFFSGSASVGDYDRIRGNSIRLVRSAS